MKEIDPGHSYLLDQLDGNASETLVFVKRCGDGYPGNIGSYPGTNLQEVLRALIARVIYLDNQVKDHRNAQVIFHLRLAIWLLEARAAERHNRPWPTSFETIEHEPVCSCCGHIGCKGDCHD